MGHDFLAYESSDGLFRNDVEESDVIALASKSVFLLEEFDPKIESDGSECSDLNDTEVCMNEELDLELELEEEARVFAAVGLVRADFSQDILTLQNTSWLGEEVNEAIAGPAEVELDDVVAGGIDLDAEF